MRQFLYNYPYMSMVLSQEVIHGLFTFSFLSLLAVHLLHGRRWKRSVQVKVYSQRSNLNGSQQIKTFKLAPISKKMGGAESVKGSYFVTNSGRTWFSPFNHLGIQHC